MIIKDLTHLLTLINPGTRELVFRIFNFTEDTFDGVNRLNYFICFWVKKGKGICKFNFSECEMRAGQVFFFSPYEPFQVTESEPLSGVCICFHPEFLYLENHKHEIGWDGVLFNNIYRAPSLNLSQEDSLLLDDLLRKMKAELERNQIAQHDILVAYLRIFLIVCSRLKIHQAPNVTWSYSEKEDPAVLQKLKDLIEANYRKTRSPVNYAKMLNVNQKSLSNITKRFFKKSMTDLIQERVVIEAKRELFLTNKTIKEIASELGFEDEYYFSRLFKNIAHISPRYFREKVGYARA